MTIEQASPTASRSRRRRPRHGSTAAASVSTPSKSRKARGAITGAAFVGWDGTYSFNADGRRIPVDAIARAVVSAGAALGPRGVHRQGNGAFDAAAYDVRFRVNDLFVARGRRRPGHRDAGASRSGAQRRNRRGLAAARGDRHRPHRADAAVGRRDHLPLPRQLARSVRPPVRAQPLAVSPPRSPAASIRVVGAARRSRSPASRRHGRFAGAAAAGLRRAQRHADPPGARLDARSRVNELRLEGVDTRLRVGGTVGLQDERIALQVAGDANLGILQGFFPGSIRGSGRAELTAAIDGPLRQPQFSGNATLTNGRIRHFSVPNSLDAINGTIRFDAGGIRLDDVTATMGGGLVRFGGRIGFDGYVPADLDVTARGNDLRLRYPEGIRSVVDMDLAVRGNVRSPTLGGLVTVKNALWNRRIDTPGNIFDLAGAPLDGGRRAGERRRAGGGVSVEVRRADPGALDAARREQPGADGRERGPHAARHLRSAGDRRPRRHRARRGDVRRAALPRSRAARWTSRTRRASSRSSTSRPRPTCACRGRPIASRSASPARRDQLRPTLNSDPPLPTVGRAGAAVQRRAAHRHRTSPELRALQNPNQTQTDILTARATQALAGAAVRGSRQGRRADVRRRHLPADAVVRRSLQPADVAAQPDRAADDRQAHLGPRLPDVLAQPRHDRSTIRSCCSSIDESDRLSWILSRNEDSQTYALEFRVRHMF